MTKKNIVLGIFIDLKKAFDTVSHKILLQKLRSIVITGEAFNILSSYLSDRYQVVKIGDSKSEALPIEFGVPQGSLLAPLLFNIYINSIKDLGLEGQITLYADDTCLFYFGRSLSDIITNAQRDLNMLHIWFSYNLLTINTSKTSYIIFSAKNKKLSCHQPLHINHVQIKRSSCEKYLGLKLDNKLCWTPHIESIKSKLMSLLGSMRGYINNFPRNIRLTIYNSLVKSHLNYLIEIWGCASKSTLKDLQIAQNKIIKTLFNYNYLTPTSQLYRETKLMSVGQLYAFNTCLLIRKIIDGAVHSQLNFTRKITKRSERHPNQLCTQQPRTQYGRRNIRYEGVQLYNALPIDIRNASSLAIFKARLKLHLAGSENQL